MYVSYEEPPQVSVVHGCLPDLTVLLHGFLLQQVLR